MLSTLRQPKPKSKSEVVYPESDGEPLAETDLHATEMVALMEALQEFFSDKGDVYVAMDNFVYFEKDNPSACISPDVYVVKGIANYERDTFKIWEEGGRVPSVVFEVTSASTKSNDLIKKKRRYQALRVPEYFLFDPRSEYLRPNLQGFRLAKGAYVPIASETDGSVLSAELGLKFIVKDEVRLRVIDPATGRILSRVKELRKQLSDAELEIARLKEELNRLKK